MELTQEYFDTQLKGLATKDDIKNMATKDDLASQTRELKEFAEDQTDVLARIIATTIAEPMERHFQSVGKELDVYAEVKELKADMKKIKEALHLSPSGS